MKHAESTAKRAQGARPQTSGRFLMRLFRHVLPAARQELQRWQQRAAGIPDAQLQQQALASLRHKRFHADGGCVYAAACPTAQTGTLVRLIVALQTISDYLDNLCDRAGRTDEAYFHRLHDAMRDAVRPDAPLRAYYDDPQADDGGYLADLVRTCQTQLRQLPRYSSVSPQVEWLVERYCELQELKHIDPDHRRSRLEDWSSGWESTYPAVRWWEFSAATGSTLAMFALFSAASDDADSTAADTITTSYFPWICGLHILLDYLIDLEEDKRGGDFNFVRCYASTAEAFARLREFARRSVQAATQLTASGRIHTFVVHGLLAMYLSDRKAYRGLPGRTARRLVWEFGPPVWLFYWACVVYRIVR